MNRNLLTENLLTFRQLASRLPRRRNNRAVSPSTIFRWRSRGLRGVRLEAMRLGGSWVTSEQAFERIVEQLTGEANDGESPPIARECDKSSHRSGALDELWP